MRADGKTTFVKGEIYSGSTPVAENAAIFWDSLTKTTPPQRWRPSVAGAILDRGDELDPVTMKAGTVIRVVRWTNIGFSKTPVNPLVPAASAEPIGTLAKSLDDHMPLIRKALEAGYGTDSAALAGGAALRTQSLDPKVRSYWDFRDRIAGDVRRGTVSGRAADIVAHAAKTFGTDESEGADWTAWFLHTYMKPSPSGAGRRRPSSWSAGGLAPSVALRGPEPSPAAYPRPGRDDILVRIVPFVLGSGGRCRPIQVAQPGPQLIHARDLHADSFAVKDA